MKYVITDQKIVGATDDTKIGNDGDQLKVIAPLPVGAATSANQVTELASLASIDSKLTNPLPVSGPLTDAQLRATPVPVDTELPTATALADATANPTTPLLGAALEIFNGTTWDRARGDISFGVDVDVTRLPSLPTGGNTIGTVDQGIGGSSAWKVDGSAVTQPVSAVSLPLPTGASTSALQTTGNSSLSSIDGKLANNYGVSTGAVRTASQIGNTTGAADFNSGVYGAQTLRVVLPTNQPAVAIQDSAIIAAITSITTGGGFLADIFKSAEWTVTAKTETDLATVTYTVPAAKNFYLTSFSFSYDAQSTIYFRLKKQTGGAGAFATLLRGQVGVNGQDSSTKEFTFPQGVKIATATDVIKVTIEASLIKGSAFAGFTGASI